MVQPGCEPDLRAMNAKERKRRTQTRLDPRASGKLLSSSACLSSSLSSGSWLAVVQPQLLSCQVSHCLCLWPWQTAQVSHSGSSAPSDTPARIPGGSRVEWQHSPITPLKPSVSCSPGTPRVESTLCLVGQNLETLPVATQCCFHSEF